MSATNANSLTEKLKIWKETGNEHVIEYYNQKKKESEALEKQLSQLDVKTAIKGLTEALARRSLKRSDDFQLDQFPEVVSRDDAKRSALWRKIGYEAICNGKVAVVILAGGQGTRLGSCQPKGMYDVGLPSGKTLFQLQAERLEKIAKLAHQAVGNDSTPPEIPWYMMTSTLTHQETVAFFTKHNHFGRKQSPIFFFKQGVLPCVTKQGHVIMEHENRVAVAPNGNGGVYDALRESGALQDMKKRGVEVVFFSGVDNILMKICDPVFMGMMIEQKCDAAAKVVPKAYAEERVGILGLRNGRPSVVEYSEMSARQARRKDPVSGQLIYNTANICIHGFSLDFLNDTAADYHSQMPYHLAFKQIPHIDKANPSQSIKPTEPNGYKLELFIFDVFPFAKNMVVMEVVREEEFAPLKNAPGSARDCPETCRQLLKHLHAKWIEKAGGKITSNTQGEQPIVEISPLLSYEGEGLEAAVHQKTFNQPCCIEPSGDCSTAAL
mmetsp:Transcript_20288/g.30145  ORF Transcript_20288/g.30145 Transcript_20288/m.30145 type:complete len:495 (+) Transcript_20288:120-1604(+)